MVILWLVDLPIVTLVTITGSFGSNAKEPKQSWIVRVCRRHCPASLSSCIVIIVCGQSSWPQV